MNLISWVKERSDLGKNLIFTINRSVLLVLMLTLSPSVVFPGLFATALGINTGLRKGHAGWILTVVQTGMIWIAFHLFQFKNPVLPQQQQMGMIIMTVLTMGAGFVGVLLTHYQESRGAPL